MKMFTPAARRPLSAAALLTGLALLAACAPRVVTEEPDTPGATFDPGPVYTASAVLPSTCTDLLARVRGLSASLRPGGDWGGYAVVSGSGPAASPSFVTLKAHSGTDGPVTSSVWLCGQDSSVADGGDHDSAVLRVSTLGLDQQAATRLHDAFLSAIGGSGG